METQSTQVKSGRRRRFSVEEKRRIVAEHRPTAADLAAQHRRRPRPLKLAGPSPLRDSVVELPSNGYSPWATTQLCARDPATATVCHETIYQAIYDGTLGLKPGEYLRSKRRRRNLHNPPHTKFS